MNEQTESNRSLEEVLAACLRAAEEGRPSDPKTVLAAHPELAVELEDFFSGQEWMRGHLRHVREVPGALALPFRFGRYELIEELGRGGMGVVYRARDLDLNGRLVALKVIRFGQFASPEDVAQFRREAEAAAELDHPHIVPIYDFGLHEGQPYFTMKLIEGKSLQERLPEFQADPAAAAHLLKDVADAVRYAHRRTILHRDLKPANILIDAAGQPHVTDFGLAKRLDGAGEASGTEAVEGTLPYMAPEQVSGQKGRLTLFVDVYGLGATLYALLVGRPPFEGDSIVETIRKILEEDPADPRGLNPRVDADLAAVCLMCLRKEPQQRYENAGALAGDLENWRLRRPVKARLAGRLERFELWCRRHAAAVTISVTAGLLLLSLAGWFIHQTAVRMARREEILITNATMAQDVAERFRLQFREWGSTLTRVAADPELLDLLERGDLSVRDGPAQRALQALCARMPFSLDEFEGWSVLDAEGTMRGRWEDNDNRREGKNFGLRDYVQGPLAHFQKGLSGAHVSRAFRATHGEIYNIALSVPIHRAGKFLGVLRLSVNTGRSMGLGKLHDVRRRVVVVALWDDSYAKDSSEKKVGHRIILHPLFSHSQKPVGVEHPRLELLSASSCEHELDLAGRSGPPQHASDYRDPVDGGTWLAGFAPIGSTGYVVIVQQRNE